MNKNKLKAYAPQARRDFTAAVKARAALLGISGDGVSPASRSGDVVIVEGREWPAKVGAQRDRLVAKIGKEGFGAVMERVAYTWFNRFAALRYMELHDYLGHGHRVLSNRDGGLPEILAHAGEVELPGLDKARVVELRLAGDRDGDLYRMLLVAQCNALSATMPFLFERIDDESELLLPDNLLRTDSVVAKMVSSVDEGDWEPVEIVGWLYQFYISEKKDAVIGGVVKSEDIPAATQLFTPDWIVKYLVQNSVGRLWLMANPASPLRSKWEYHVESAEQTCEVRSSLDTLIISRVSADSGSLNPETITVLDPACGSGHILVQGYDVLKDIYLERGYQPRAIPRLILEKNLFGLDIDDRAAQLAGFALLMKARADDRRLFSEPPKLNVSSFQESKGLDADELGRSVKKAVPTSASTNMHGIASLVGIFQHAKTFGSLIKIPLDIQENLGALAEDLNQALVSNDLYAQAAAQDVLPLVKQASVLGMKFDAVIANPPYMGPKGMNLALKGFAKTDYSDSKSDLYAMFIERSFEWCKPTGFVSMVTMHSWMFLSSFETMREKLLRNCTIQTMAHFGARAFAEISGEVVQTTAFVLQAKHLNTYKPVFFRLVDGGEVQKEKALRSGQCRYESVTQNDFSKIPGSPLAYWANSSVIDLFTGLKIFDLSISDGQNITANNDRYVRSWWEVSARSCGMGKKWLTYCKGGEFRKWYGNLDAVVDWSPEARAHYRSSDRCRIIPEYLWYREGITWSRVASKDSPSSFRLMPKDSTFDKVGSSIFIKDEFDLKLCLGLLNSVVSNYFIPMLNPSIDLQVRDVRNIPYHLHSADSDVVSKNVSRIIELSTVDWESLETSEKFSSPLVSRSFNQTGLHESHRNFAKSCQDAIDEVKGLEEKNNSIFIDAYGLQAELSPEVPVQQITLTRANREADSKRLISYAIGCMMGRYSLDEPGLIYADAGNVGFKPERYTTFPADADGIVPLTDELWFEDDAALRVTEFVRAVWGRETLEENMAWLGESLGGRNGETGEETVRRYLSSAFNKDHLQTFKRRPIYWLFSSGKQKGFEALVYLHRYQEGTLARMRSEYVVPLLSKYLDRIEMLGRDAEAAGSAAGRTKIQKKIDALRKKHHELVGFEEKLRHTADTRIRLDLDDGVKANYGKFGDLLAETKAVTGGAED